MASFAEIMLQQQGEAQSKVGSGLAESFSTGMEIAQRAESLKQKREEINAQKAQFEQAKLAKFVDAVEKGQSYAGKAMTNYYNKFLPALRDSLGLTDKFSDETLQFMTSDKKNLARVQTLIADVRSGARTEQEALAIINDPTVFADVVPADTYKLLGEAAKTSIENRQELNKQQRGFEQQTQEKQAERAATGEVKLAEETAKEFKTYEAGGGEAAYEKAIAGYEDAIKQLESGKIQLGTLMKKIPFGGDEAVLSRLDPEAKALMDQIRDNINIRAKTGDPNPTEKQIDAILARSLDPKLSNSANIKKLRSEVLRMKQENETKKNLFQQQGFVRGTPKEKTSESTPSESPLQDAAKREKALQALAAKKGISVDVLKQKLGIK